MNLKFIFNESRYKPTLSDLLTALKKSDPDFAGKQYWERFNRDEFMAPEVRNALFGGNENSKNYQAIENFFNTNFSILF